MFSNFAELPLTMGGLKFGSVEHYFQYMKFFETDPKYAEKIRKAATPYECKQLSNSRDHIIDPEWKSKRLRIMKLALFCKALQHPSFAQALLDTGRAHLIEAAPYDYFWGEGKDRTGRNLLGQFLMQLRKNLYFNRDKMYRDPDAEEPAVEIVFDMTPAEEEEGDEEAEAEEEEEDQAEENEEEEFEDGGEEEYDDEDEEVEVEED